MKNLFVFFSIYLVFSYHLFAQKAGDLDSSFGTNGVVITPVRSTATSNSIIQSLAIQPDKKIVAAGWVYNGYFTDTITLARYNENGSLDNSFGIGGLVITPIGKRTFAKSIVLQTDGKIIVGGFDQNAKTRFVLIRYNSDGTLDNSFGYSGITITDLGYKAQLNAIALQNDGKIVATGELQIDSVSLIQFVVARYTATGTPDTSFGTYGVTATTIGSYGIDAAQSLTIQNDGKIIIAGYSQNGPGSLYQFAMARYKIDGILDTSFGLNGIVTNSVGAISAISFVTTQIDNKILAVGYTAPSIYSDSFAIARYNIDGSLDTVFGKNGVITTNFGTTYADANSAVVQKDNKIIIAGRSGNASDLHFSLVRYQANGSLDTSFGNNGNVRTALGTTSIIVSAAIDKSGKIIAAGQSEKGSKYDFTITRYLSELNLGLVNFNTQNNSLFVYPNPVKNNAILVYSLEKSEIINIQLVDVQGQLQKIFVNNTTQEKGEHRLNINLPDGMPLGTYFIILSSGNKKVSISITK